MSYSVVTRSALTVLRAADRSDRRLDLKRADALVALKGDGHSLAQTVTLLGKEGIALSKTRISLLIRAREAAPADVTADDFVLIHVRAVTDANRAGKAPKAEPTEDTSSRGGTSERTVPQGNDTPVTIADVLAAIALAVEFAQVHSDARQAIADALFDASEALQPVVLIATPVAA